MVLIDLLVSWGRIGVAAFGGGPAMIPYMKAECVDLRGWMTEQQFLDGIALAYTLPGPLSAKMSVLAGWRAAGLAGAAVALLSVMLPPALLMGLLMSAWFRFRDAPWLAGAMKAVRPAVIGLLAYAAIDLAPSAVRSWPAAALGLATLVALLLRVHPVLVVLGAMALGAVLFR